MSAPQRMVFTPRMHAAICASGAAIAFSGVVVATYIGTSWSWHLFVWGLLLGPVIVPWLTMQNALLVRRLGKAAGRPVDVRTVRAERLRRCWSTYVSTCCIGFTVGAASASLGTAWPDGAMTAYFLVFSVLIPAAVYPALKRKLSSRPSD